MSHRILPARRDPNKERIHAYRRRIALIKDGCATYRLLPNPIGVGLSIQCLCCGITSHNTYDVGDPSGPRYCSFCQAWHSDWAVEPVDREEQKP